MSNLYNTLRRVQNITKPMANWCSSSVTVTGDWQRVKILYGFILRMREQEKKTKEGQRHMFSKVDEWLHNIYFYEEDIVFNENNNSFEFDFESKWSTSDKALVEMATLHRVNIWNSYTDNCGFIGETKTEYDEETQEFTVSSKYLGDDDYETAKESAENEDCEHEAIEQAFGLLDFEITVQYNINEYGPDIINQI